MQIGYCCVIACGHASHLTREVQRIAAGREVERGLNCLVFIKCKHTPGSDSLQRLVRRCAKGYSFTLARTRFPEAEEQGTRVSGKFCHRHSSESVAHQSADRCETEAHSNTRRAKLRNFTGDSKPRGFSSRLWRHAQVHKTLNLAGEVESLRGIAVPISLNVF